MDPEIFCEIQGLNVCFSLCTLPEGRLCGSSQDPVWILAYVADRRRPTGVVRGSGADKRGVDEENRLRSYEFGHRITDKLGDGVFIPR